MLDVMNTFHKHVMLQAQFTLKHPPPQHPPRPHHVPHLPYHPPHHPPPTQQKTKCTIESGQSTLAEASLSAAKVHVTITATSWESLNVSCL